MAKLEGDLTAIGASNNFAAFGKFNFSLKGFGSASVDLERSLNGGNTWDILETFTGDVSKTGENAGACLLRVNCTAYTSGTIHYILSSGFYGA
jgi:hypothetical protein